MKTAADLYQQLLSEFEDKPILPKSVIQLIARKEKEVIAAAFNTVRFSDNEATANPYWAVCRWAAYNGSKRPVILAGIFFSRIDAEIHLNQRRYEYGEKAFVYCFSAYHSKKYRALQDTASVLIQSRKEWGIE